MEDVGRIIRQLRTERGMSIRKLSQETGFSVSFLSKLENGKTSITVRNLVKLLNYFGVTLADIFSPPAGKKIAYRKEERKVLQSSEKITLELLVEDREAQMEPLMVTFEPRARYEEALEHGGEEFAYVARGEVRFEIDNASHFLRQGDCVYFPGASPHAWENLSDDVSLVLMVITPPSV